jgi:predicted permease
MTATTHIYIHIMLQTLAFFVLFPLGVIIAAFRSVIGQSWLFWHVCFQLLGSVCVVAAVMVISMASKKHHNHTYTHRLLGKVVVSLIVIELIWAFIGRRIVPWNVWLTIHVVLATLILACGWANIYLGVKMRHTSKNDDSGN